MSRMTKTLPLLVAAGICTLSAATAQDWSPKGPITLQVAFAAGGSTDTLARILAQEMERDTGWDVVVQNRPGGGGVAMLSGLMRDDPDGMTLGVGVTIPIVMQLAARGDRLPFRADSFDYLGTISEAPLAVAAPVDAPFGDFRELVQFARDNGGANVGFDGNDQELMLLAVNNTDGAGFRPVSFNTSAEVIQAMLGGHIDAGFVGGAHVEYVRSGRLRMIASATAERHGYAPDTETLVEQGYPYFVDGYFFVAAPLGLPDDVAATLEAALGEAVDSEAVGEVAAGLSLQAVNIGGEATLSSMVNGAAAAAALVAAAAQ